MVSENGRPRTAAILVDFDNVCLGLANSFGAGAARSFALAPQNWLAWFAGGGHSGLTGGERRFIVRRVYMAADSFRRSRRLCALFANPETRAWAANDEDDPFVAFQRVQRAFTAAGLEIVDLPPIGGLKGSAPVRMAIDALELLDHGTRIDEFVLMCGDSDLSAVLPRLRAQGRATTILCETIAARAIEGLVDEVVTPDDFVRLAFNGKPAVRTLIETVERAMNGGPPPSLEPEEDLLPEPAPPPRPALSEAPNYEVLPRVAKRVREAIEAKGEAIEAIDLVPLFREFPEFTQVRSDQLGAWFGAGGLSNLVRKLAALDPRLKIAVRGARATRAGRVVDRLFLDAETPAKPAGRRRAAAANAAPIEEPALVQRALDLIKDEVSRSRTPLHMNYLRLVVLEELGPAAAAAGLADVGGKALRDAALRYGVEPYSLVEPRPGYVLVLDPLRHEMPE